MQRCGFMIYKNTSRSTKTFYGVTFKPGESREVPGYITNPDFIVSDTIDSVDEKKPVPKKTTTTKSKNADKEESEDGTDHN